MCPVRLARSIQAEEKFAQTGSLGGERAGLEFGYAPCQKIGEPEERL